MLYVWELAYRGTIQAKILQLYLSGPINKVHVDLYLPPPALGRALGVGFPLPAHVVLSALNSAAAACRLAALTGPSRLP